MAKNDAQQQADEQASTQQADEQASVEARVLCDCLFGKADAVVSLSTSDVKYAKEQGMVDDHPEAVAYAKSLK